MRKPAHHSHFAGVILIPKSFTCYKALDNALDYFGFVLFMRIYIIGEFSM